LALAPATDAFAIAEKLVALADERS
jgi:hypothetical protein